MLKKNILLLSLIAFMPFLIAVMPQTIKKSVVVNGIFRVIGLVLLSAVTLRVIHDLRQLLLF